MTVAALLLGAVPCVCGQGYPRNTVNLVIPVAAGDAADIAGRTMAEELSRLLKVPFVVTNKPGAGAVLGAGEVARAKKDGYTLLLTVNSALTFRPVLDPKTIPYDTSRDLTPPTTSSEWSRTTSKRYRWASRARRSCSRRRRG